MSSKCEFKVIEKQNGEPFKCFELANNLKWSTLPVLVYIPEPGMNGDNDFLPITAIQIFKDKIILLAGNY